jgi:hypothetical protein
MYVGRRRSRIRIRSIQGNQEACVQIGNQ